MADNDGGTWPRGFHKVRLYERVETVLKDPDDPTREPIVVEPGDFYSKSEAENELGHLDVLVPGTDDVSRETMGVVMDDFTEQGRRVEAWKNAKELIEGLSTGTIMTTGDMAKLIVGVADWLLGEKKTPKA